MICGHLQPFKATRKSLDMWFVNFPYVTRSNLILISQKEGSKSQMDGCHEPASMLLMHSAITAAGLTIYFTEHSTAP